MVSTQEKVRILTGAEILLSTLKSFEVDSVFGYPGGIVLAVYDELYKQNEIKHYLVRHEQSAIHAAEGYARASGKCGVALVTSGPAATNIVTGLANAYLDSYPLVVITGQVSAELIGKDAFQEVDIISITKSCTKKNFQVTNAETLQQTLIDAFEVATSGRQGPVVVDISKNVFVEKANYLENFLLKNKKNDCDEFSVEEAIKALLMAKTPVVIAGGGIVQSGASEEVYRLVKMLNIPVVNTMMGLGTYPQDDENYLGMIGIFGEYSANQVVRESDLVFAIGARLNDRIRCCFNEGELDRKLIHLDIDENEINRVLVSSISLVGDAKLILNKILAELEKKEPVDFYKWLAFARELSAKNVTYQKKSELMHSFEVLKIINEYTQKRNLVVTTEVGQHQVWASRVLKFNKTRRFLTSGGLGTMGFGFSAAIGATIANNMPVVCITGDGSFQMSIQEIMTCVDYNLPVKIFILNNGHLGMVRQLQEKMCEKRYSETKISNPDFIKIANAYGVKGIRVEALDDVTSALDEAFSIDGTVIVDFLIEPMEVL
ncbi:MAG: biosynthetic-type acetolactate synthase large subunit [Candidatus Gastranaerophilales bacterium]